MQRRFPHHKLRVTWSEEDDAFLAETVEVPYCFGFGQTVTAAIEEVEDEIANAQKLIEFLERSKRVTLDQLVRA